MEISAVIRWCRFIFGALVQLLAVSTSGQDLEYEPAYTFPKQLPEGIIYMEKYEPIYLHDVQHDLVDLKMYSDSADFRENLVELLDLYNKLLVRKLNEDLQRSIDEFDLTQKVKLIYPRDLADRGDSSASYVIRPQANVIELFIRDYRERSTYHSTQYWSFEDLSGSRRYKRQDSGREVLAMLASYQQNSVRVADRDHKWVEKLAERRRKRAMAGGGEVGRTALYVLVYLVPLAGLTIIANTAG